MELTGDDVLQEDTNVVVPVGPGLLMVESQSMQQLMLDNLVENTPTAAQRHHLGAATATDKRPTPGGRRDRSITPDDAGEAALSCLWVFLPAAGLDVHKVSFSSVGPEADAGGGVK